ncbi:MAG TPA: DUF4870 domain-containing protein [Rhodoglobus sp.]|nr:DUF4870 domain-containing protein [Rhodoglobus sp.]
MSDSTPPPANPYNAPQPLSPADEKLWATLVHVGGILFGFLPAVIGYLLLKDRGPFVRAHTATALNFQITLAIAYVVGIVTSLIVIGFLIIIAVSIVSLIFSIIAAVAANRGELYTYPIAIKFVS